MIASAQPTPRPQKPGTAPQLLEPVPRRSFLKFAGLGAVGVALASAGCHIQKETPSGRLDIGKHDLAVLNYADALEQLEGAFYEKVVSGFYAGRANWKKTCSPTSATTN